MSTATLPDTDIANAVEAAFDELDCCSQRKHIVPCGGPIRAFQEYHDCVQGWLCENHWKHAVDVAIPDWRSTLAARGWIGCQTCMKRFESLRKYCVVTPIPPR